MYFPPVVKNLDNSQIQITVWKHISAFNFKVWSYWLCILAGTTTVLVSVLYFAKAVNILHAASCINLLLLLLSSCFLL